MDDIQSWWEVPSIAHFCSLFRVAFNLLDFDIEELEEALLTDGTELNGSSLLQDLIVRLLCGCLGHNGISTFNYQMFLRRLFRTKCKEQGRENPFNTDIDFQFLPLRTKVEILHALCDFRLDADDVIDVLKNLDSDSLRVHPLGHDESKAAYWYFYGTRLYKEEYPKKRKRKKDHDKYKSKKKKNKNETSSDEESDELGGTSGTWKVMCYTEDDWRNLADSLAGSTSKEERALYAVLSEDFLPEIPRLFEEKERLQKKRLMENQPRRQSQRIEKLKSMKNDNADGLSTNVGKTKEEDRYSERERVNREKFERRERRAVRALRRSHSNSSDDNSSAEGIDDIGGPTLVGRQTNNSLASATGEIIIKPTRQKFRNSQLFRRTREDLMTGMYKILDRVKAHDDAWPFLDPVDEAYAPKYYAVIAKPMDLQTMEDKLDNGEYGSLQQFKADFQLIVDNCRQYNGSGNEYTEMAKRLQELFESSAERYLEIEPSSEEEPPLENHSDDTLGSSLTPMNGPRSPSISSSCHSNCSDGDNYINYDSYSNRTKHSVREHKSRLRKRQKRKKKTTKDYYSTADDYSSRDTSRSKSRHNTRRPRSLTDSSNDRSKTHRKPRKDKRDSSSEVNEEKFKDHVKINNRESSHDRNKNKDSFINNEIISERNRTRVNYKEDETSESEILSDSSDDSHYNGKFKPKTPPKKPVKRAGVIKNSEALAALELATEETLKDISRWLDDTPKFSEFSSNSNSPLHVSYTEDIANIEGEYRRRLLMDRAVRPRDRLSNDLHRRRMFKEQLGLKRRKEVQRTIDRLQPGKSKGNLLSKEHQDNSGVETKFSTSDNDDNTPKISLGKVLASGVLGFGIGDTSCKKDSEDDCTEDKLVIEEDIDSKEEGKTSKEEDESNKDSVLLKEEKPVVEIPEPKKEKPTPNLSAWFKAFGAPKTQVTVKKKAEQEEVRVAETTKNTREEESIAEEEKKLSCVVDSPARRQRKTSTGSSVSERSSFSQEPIDGNSPRPSIDEPYLSPQQEPKSYHHSPINGTIKVGFYQDTCFPRGSSEKSSSPRDLPSCSPRDLPSVSPRTPYCSPRTPYCSPRNAPISPRDYPNASPRTPYCSPRHRPMSPKDYPNSSPREIHSSSPQHFSASSPQELVTTIRRDYMNESQQEISVISPKENHPSKNDYQAYSPVPHTSNTPIYGGLAPHYPGHISYIDNTKSIAEHYRNVEKTPLSVYPVKKRAYNEIENVQSKSTAEPMTTTYKGGSFTPTRGAMEQERTFTPTPGRLPGPSQALRVTESALPLGLTHPLQHHLIDPYGDERHLSSTYYPSESVFSKGQTASTSHPIFSQPGVLTSSFTRDNNISHNFERHDNDSNIQSRIIPAYDSRNTPTTYCTTSQPEPYKGKPPLINYTNRNSPPRLNTASPNSQLPLNYSSVNSELTNKESPSTSKVSESQRMEDVPATSTAYNKVHCSPDLTHEKFNAPSSLAFTNSRLSEMLPPKVNTSYNRSIPEISSGINYGPSQDLSKISVPLTSYSNQTDLLTAKMNYNHPMADLMQSSARYNYQVSELMQGKSSAYNHPIQDFIQGKPTSYSNIIQPNLANYNRPIGDIMQRKVGDIQSSEMVYPSPRTSLPPVNKPELPPKPKKGRKKKTETPPSGFQQYIAPTSEPLSLKTSGVPGSAFNFGPPLKDSYSYLEDIRSPYYVSRSENSPNKSGTSHSPSYFLGHTSSRAPTYPHALYNAQYQEYLQCATRHSEELLRPMVIHQGLLPPAAGYPPGYLGMPNTINRPSWL